jgi:23S rRNA (pseudouridine1915-N3)-methyltransferase
MKIKIIAVGKIKGPEQALVERYSKRLPWPLEIVEIDDRQRRSANQKKDRETQAIAARLPKNPALIALSQSGKPLSSLELAKTIDRYQEDAHKELVFLIGGADGLGQTLLARSDLELSFGPMTWPHMMARAMLVEQIYRAASILAGHPYHRD